MTHSGKNIKSLALSEEKDSKKIWITLPIKYSDILDILADDSPTKTRSNRKSVVIEKMIDEYLEKHQKELTDDGKWVKIISVRKQAASRLLITITEKIDFVSHCITTYSELSNLKEIWEKLKIGTDPEAIEKIYDKLAQKYSPDTQKLDEILATI